MVKPENTIRRALFPGTDCYLQEHFTSLRLIAESLFRSPWKLETLSLIRIQYKLWDEKAVSEKAEVFEARARCHGS